MSRTTHPRKPKAARVGAKRSKGALIDLVTWLLLRAEAKS